MSLPQWRDIKRVLLNALFNPRRVHPNLRLQTIHNEPAESTPMRVPSPAQWRYYVLRRKYIPQRTPAVKLYGGDIFAMHNGDALTRCSSSGGVCIAVLGYDAHDHYSLLIFDAEMRRELPAMTVYTSWHRSITRVEYVTPPQPPPL